LFTGYESWVEQYFKDIESSEKVVICCNDTSAWKMYPDYNWVYNKLELCKSQNIESGPHGVKPSFEPVFSKPVINLYGQNRRALKIFSWEDAEYYPGHFWMPVFNGTHLSSDMALVDGVSQWCYTMQAFENDDGQLTRYESANGEFEELVDKAKLWALTNLKGYTGIVNIETINGKIIDCHLRMMPRLVDLYSEGWLEAVSILYDKQTWTFNRGTESGYSYTLRASENGTCLISDKDRFDEIKNTVSSIQKIFKNDCNIVKNGRLVIVNGCDATIVNDAINELNEIIILTDE